MNIKFKKIELKGFLSIGEIKTNLDDRGFVLVEGKNEHIDDGAVSNGSGKSSIFEGILWILTGDTLRGTKKVVNKNMTIGTSGLLEFSADDKEYKIIRYREDVNYGTDLKIYVDGEDVSGKGIRDSEKILKSYLPDLDTQLIGSVIVLGQGLPQRFTNNTPSGRKEVLEFLSKSDFMIEDIKNKLSSRRTLLNDSYTNLDKDIAKLDSEYEVNVNTIQDRKIKIKESNDKINDNTLNEELVRNKEEIDTINSQLEKIEDIEYYYKETDKLNQENNKIKEKENEIDKQVISVESDVRNIKREIHNLKNVKTHCPTCNRPFDDVHVIDTSDKEAELSKLEEEVVALKETKKPFVEDKTKIRNKLEEIKSKIQETKEEKLNLENRKDRLVRLNESKEKEQEQLKLKIDMWKNDIVESTDRNLEIVEEIKTLKTKLKKVSKKLDSVNKLRTLAARDFRGYLLESFVNYIESRMSFYSLKLFNSNRVEFKLDGNDIQVGFDGKQYENLSGGEKQKVDLMIQFSIRDMLMTMLNFSCNILVLDEVFDNLDNDGCESLIDLIMTSLNDIQSVYIITHHSDINIPHDDKMVIIKNEDSISYLEEH